MLLEHHAPVNANDQNGASGTGSGEDISVMKELQNKGADINGRNHAGIALCLQQS